MEPNSGGVGKPGQMLISETRPVLVALACRHFMERGKYPEVVKSCMFQIWRSLLAMGKWAGGKTVSTDLSNVDAEGRTPAIPESKDCSFSFACIEALGVFPPPTGGWLPKEAKKEEENSPEKNAEWWGNVQNPEWIYHDTDGMYFHVPSSTLWERQKLDCCDTLASPHTYCRVDAFHLQALRNFAQSIDALLMPTVWKAWVRWVKKRRASEMVGPNASRHQRSPKGGSRSPKIVHDEVKPPDTSQQNPAVEFMQNPLMEAKGSATAEKSPFAPLPSAPNQMANMNTSQTLPLIMRGGPSVAPGGSAGGALTAMTTSPPRPASAANSGDDSDRGSKKRGCCPCFCGRGRRASESTPGKAVVPERREDASNMKSVTIAATDIVAAATVTASTEVAAVRASTSTVVSPGEPKPQENCDFSERYTRRLDVFLDEVKRNPQRLITHVERRRAEKTHLAYIVI